MSAQTSIVVDRYELGPIGTNCYLVRSSRTAEEGVVIDPSGDAAQLRLELAGLAFETMRVPGHSPGHLALAADGCLYSGDVLFAGSVGRTDLPGADWDTLVETLRVRTERCPGDTLVYSGHGPPKTLGTVL